jgi:hypothetical protein
MATSFYKWLVLPVLSFGLSQKIDGFLHSQNSASQIFHPIHISTVEISHNATEKSLEITCKIFWDDFETILTKKNNNKRVDLTNEKNLDGNNKLVADYISKHLSITVDGKLVPLSFVGFEKEDMVVYSYMEVTNVANVKNVSITNNLMHDMFDDQTNIMHVIVKGERKSTKLDYPATSAKMEF